MTWLDVLAQQARANLTDEVRERLYARGVTDGQMVDFRIGYLDRTLPELEGAEDFYRWAKGRRLENVYVFPLTTPLGVTRGFQFRPVERAQKGYLDFIPYKEEPVLFGLGQAMPHVWRQRGIWIVEGVFDLFPLQRHVPNIVATLTARVPDNLTRVMRRLVDQIWLGYDADAAGKAAMTQFVRSHGQEFRVHPVYYPQVRMVGSEQKCKDPGDLWEAWGDEQFGRFIQTVLRSADPMEFSNA